MAKLTCQLTIVANSEHTYQIITGFILLEREGLIDLDMRFVPKQVKRYPTPHMVEAVINNEIRVAYDVLDGYNFDLSATPIQDYLDSVDLYFKRSFNPELHRHWSRASQIQPLGLNYQVMTNHGMFTTLNSSSLGGFSKHAAKYASGHYKTFAVERFEDIPRRSSDATILFTTRTWDPQGEDGDGMPAGGADERAYINATRADCIRALRKEFGARFVGGFAPSQYAAKHFPDCMLEASVTKKKNYVALVKRSDICVATMGLHQSNGWKLGEYVAASKAIVSERLRHVVPGDFSSDNYVEFNTPDECVERTVQLATDRDRMFTMKVSNYKYYHQFLRPNRLIMNTLTRALEQASEKTSTHASMV